MSVVYPNASSGYPFIFLLLRRRQRYISSLTETIRRNILAAIPAFAPDDKPPGDG
jgi:hypothetical protein